MAEETPPATKDFSRKSKKRGKDRSEDELTRLFSGDGVSHRAKVIGSEPVPGPSGHKICQDAMMKLKAVAAASRARGQHKQRVLLSISFKGIRVYDEKSGVTEYEHPIGFISYVARDASDPRAFGYVCGAAGAHCFYAVKTVQPAEPLVMDLHDVFQLLRSKKGPQPQNAGRDPLDEQKNFEQLALFGEISTSIEPPSPVTPAEEGWSNPTWGSPSNIAELIRDPSSEFRHSSAPQGPGSVAQAGGGAAGNVVVFLGGACRGETDTDDPDPASAQAHVGAAVDDTALYAAVSKPSRPQAQPCDTFSLPPLSFDDDFTASMGNAFPAALASPPAAAGATRLPLSVTIPAPRRDGRPVPAAVGGPAALAVPPSGAQQQQQQQTGRTVPQLTQAAAVLASVANQAGASQPPRADVYREAFAGLEQPAAVSQQAWISQGQAAQQAWPPQGQAPQPAWPSPGQTAQQAWPSPGQATQQAWPAPQQAFQPEWPQEQAFQTAWPSQAQALQASWPPPHGGQVSHAELDLALGGEPVVSVLPETAPPHHPPAAPQPGPARPPANAGPDPFSGPMGGVQATAKVIVV